jgi:signal transduction histidine kinase
VRIADDCRGVDPAHTRRGAGLQDIRDRIEDLGATFNLASTPGHVAVLTMSLPWPAAASARR